MTPSGSIPKGAKAPTITFFAAAAALAVLNKVKVDAVASKNCLRE
jgi:hypothetical protein